MTTFVEVLLNRARQQPDKVAYTMLNEDGVESERITYEELNKKAKGIAACLQKLGAKGDRVLLVHQPGLDFISAFMGCLYAGMIAVPTHPPGHGRSASRFEALAADCNPAVILTTQKVKARLQQYHHQDAPLQLVEVDRLDPQLASQWHAEESIPDQPAFVQYTSGSTASPKGVIVTHKNLVYTETLIQEAFRQTEESKVLSWLPFYHDMGLIGGILQPMFTGAQCILIRPMQFLQSPLCWLQAISKYRATTSGGPNFAYDYCVQKITAEQCRKLDLSCWQVAFSGSENVRAATLESFAGRFSAYGFRTEAFQPCYGLAEATLFVSGFKRHDSAIVRAFCSDGLQQNKGVAPTHPRKRTKLVSSGGVSDRDRLVIVDPESLTVCPERAIGEVWVSGDAVASGYWQKAAENETIFRARLRSEPDRTFLRTGDTGFLDDGELFITGRLKDLIIIRGVNYWPQDIEETVSQCHDSLHSGAGSAFSITDDTQAEKLVIVQETEKRRGVNSAAVLNQIRTAVGTRHELQPSAIVLVRAGTIPKTSSGKVQRYACRDAFLKGQLNAIAEWRHPGETSAPDQFAASGSLKSFDEIQSWLINEVSGLLGIDSALIKPETTLSECGLDSLNAIEMGHRIEALGLSLPAARFLEPTTIRDVAMEIVAAPSQRLSDRGALVPSATRQYSLSYGQRALWFLQRMSPENSSYNLSVAILIHSSIDRKALQRSLCKLAERHSSLRTTFSELDNHPVQTVHEFNDPAFTEYDAVAWPEEILNRRLTQEMNGPFNLETGPLIRIALYSRGNKNILQITVHHLVADFWSLGIAFEEIGQIYATETGSAADLSPARVPSYSEFVHQEVELLSGSEGNRLWKFWEEELGGELSLCTLPTDRSRDVSQTYTGKTVRAHIGGTVATDLRGFARRQGCTLYTVLLAAFKTVLFRYTCCEDILLGSPAAGRLPAQFSRLIGYCVNPLPLRTRIDPGKAFLNLLASVRTTVAGAFAHQQYPFPLLIERLQPERASVRTALFQIMFTFLGKMPGYSAQFVPFAMGEPGASYKLRNLECESIALDEQSTDFDLVLVAGDTGENADITLAAHYRSDLFDASTVDRMLGHWQVVLERIVESPESLVHDLPLMDDREIKELICAGEGPRLGYTEQSIHQFIEDITREDPARTAVIFNNEEISYDVINRRSNQLAHYLGAMGAGADVKIGICLDRSIEMAIALLAILKSGSAYVPLDPSYPEERLGYMIKDAGIQLIVTTRQHADLFSGIHAATVCIDAEFDAISRWSPANPAQTITPENLAYVIYTSGSTGRPKGVMITHRSVVNFFAAMDQVIGSKPGKWLALTSISFDISVLELLWTLSRGFQVEIAPDQLSIMPGARIRSSQSQNLDFSLFYFAATDDSENGSNYRLLLESAKFADQHGFKAVWTPERHFHTFGGLYPNPSVTAAALSTITSRVRIRAGSVVLPLHHPVRIAEEWSVVDNLSNGRVDISFASGWHANDFVLAPENYKDRKEQMIRGIDTVCKLWRGETIAARNGVGREIKIRISPRPHQPELPVWITAAGNTETFQLAGELGAGVLTHLLGQSIEQLEEKIAIYRAAWRRTGKPGDGHVTLMLHSFSGKDSATVRDTVRNPFREYLRNSVSLISGFAKNLNINFDESNCSPADMDVLLEYAFERYFETSGLFGTPEQCIAIAHKLRSIGVNEIACLIDFGVDNKSVMEGLEYLNLVRESMRKEHEASRQRITHVQCTPSMAKMLVSDPNSAKILSSVDKLLVGGEAVMPSLLKSLASGASKEIYNMYGPTETTIWSSADQIGMPIQEVSLGRPIANTQIYILDKFLNPLPSGIPGEICIGGDGLARGYLARPDVTAERFIPDSLSDVYGGRLYRTGDKGRWRSNGKLEFLGRLDYQVKVRGHRIECAEIEACLSMHPGIRDVAVKPLQDVEGNISLAAYIVSKTDPIASSDLREFMGGHLPEYMIPSYFMTLNEMPLTPNGKIDRNRLPDAVSAEGHTNRDYVAPGNALERVLADLWSEMLNIEKVCIHSNFFSIGGHSLLATTLVSRIRDLLRVDLSLQTFFKNPTVALLAAVMLRENGESLNSMAELLETVTRLNEEEVESALRAEAGN